MKKCSAMMTQLSAELLQVLAELLKTLLLKLHVGLENPDFNLTVNTAPRGDEDGILCISFFRQRDGYLGRTCDIPGTSLSCRST